jgi:Rieske Fe-S protein
VSIVMGFAVRRRVHSALSPFGGVGASRTFRRKSVTGKTNTTRPPQSPCGDCALRSRRQFLGVVTTTIAVTALSDGWPQVLGAPRELEAASQGSDDKVTYPLPASDGVSIDNKRQVILVRWQQKVYAFPLSCPHENTALRWRKGDARFQCPKHESKYQPDGTFTSGRATRNMDRFPVARDGNNVVVDLTKWYRSDTQTAAWGSAYCMV